jgi:hypothetical protein
MTACSRNERDLEVQAGHSALKIASELLALASQTASQSVQLPVIIWVHPRTSRTPTDALPRVPEITDTEGVIASTNVTDT